MHRASIAVIAVLAIMIAGVPIFASEPQASAPAPAKKESHPAQAPAPAPAAASIGAHAAPAKKDLPVAKAASASTVAPGPAAPPHQETIEEIVARVRKRLATEVPRGPKAVAPRPPVVERVTLEWRPSVVWPADLGGEAPPAAVADPNHVSLSWDAH